MNIVEMIYEAQSGHPGGSLSIADILTVLYFNEMNIDPLEPQDVNRDRCIISKGHASPALYSGENKHAYNPHKISTDCNCCQHPD